VLETGVDLFLQPTEKNSAATKNKKKMERSGKICTAD
jgi:hypothetical protein